MAGTSTWDLPSWELVCSSDSSAGTASIEFLSLATMGVWGDAKGVFDCRCTRVVRIARDSWCSAGDGEGRAGNRFQDADHRPVPGVEERVQSEDFAGWEEIGRASCRERV